MNICFLVWFNAGGGIGKAKAGIFFILAEDHPQFLTGIMYLVKDDKLAMESLKRFETDAKIKKVFFKDVKYTKTIPYRVISTYAVVVGLITFPIINQ